MTEAILINEHIDVAEVRNYINSAALRDIADPNTPQPIGTDELGRSDQTFVIDVVVTKGSQTRRASVRGREIYAVTAPLAVEAVERLSARSHPRGGAFALAAAVDAADMLRALSADLRKS